MPFPTTSILDNFNRADGALGANWGTPLWPGDQTLEIVGNRMVRNATFGFANAYWSASTFGGAGITDESWLIIADAPSGANLGIWIGAQSPNTAGLDGYLASIDGSTWTIYRIDNTGDVTLGSTISQAIATGDGIGLSRNGSGTIEIWHKPAAGAWTSLGTRSDSTYTGAGYLGSTIQGVSPQTNNAEVEEFGGGNAVAAGSPVVRPLRLFQAVKRKATY